MDMMEPDEQAFQDYESMMVLSLGFLINVEPDAEKFLQTFSLFVDSDSFPFLNALVVDSKEEKRCVARMIAIQIWNHTPLPSQNYRCKPLPKVKRNDPCLCGSHKKFKQCCGRLDMPDMAFLSEQVILTYLLQVITQKELQTVWKYLPHDLLGFIAGEWNKQSEALCKRAMLMLEPIFKQNDRDLTDKDDLAFDALLDIYTNLHKPRKKSALLKRMIEHPNKEIRSSALHRQCCILNDAGKHDEAWEFFQRAQRLDPNNPNLSHLEILLLMGQGRLEQMQQRGQYWFKRLRQLGPQGEYDDLIQTIRDIIESPSQMLGHMLEESLPGISRFLAWLEKTVNHMPDPVNKVVVDGDISTIASVSEKIHRLECDWNELFMRQDDPWEDADRWISMLEKHPELAGSMLVLDDVVNFVSYAEFSDPAFDKQLLHLVQMQIKNTLPDIPDKPMVWGYMQNRPALRLLYFLIDSLQSYEGGESSVLALASWMLEWCPEDNMGVRNILMNGLLREGLCEEAKDLGEAYIEDNEVAICYGHALALFALGEKQVADKALIYAISCAPKVVKALLRSRMAKPKCKELYGFEIHDDNYEAWGYRENMREVWKQYKGSLNWLKHISWL